MAVADAVCYLFGAVGAIWFCSAAGPKLLGVDLEAEAKQLEQQLGIKRTADGAVSGYRHFEFRAYRLPVDAAVSGKSVAEAEATNSSHRFFILRLRRDGCIIEATPDLVLRGGDVIAVTGRREAIVEILDARAEEVEDRELLDVPFRVNAVLLTKAAGRTLEQAATESWARGLWLRSIRRGEVELPIRPELILERGDVLPLSAPRPWWSAPPSSLVRSSRRPLRRTSWCWARVFLGGLAGATIYIPVGSLSVSLGTSVGALIAGLIVGHLRTRHPLFGRIPDGAIALMTSLGLAAFVAMTGLHAGPIFISALREVGLGLLLGGAVVTLTPLIVGIYFGRYVLKMNPVLLLGGVAGALTMTAAMAAVQTRSRSPVAVLGYTPAYPVSNILLTLWGTVIVIATAGTP